MGTLLLEKRLDLIQSWLKTTSEPFDDWDWDGNILTIWLNDKPIEKYANKDLKEVIGDF